MATISRLLVELGIDDQQFETKLDRSKKSLQAWGQSLAATGRSLTAGITLPLAGLGAVAINAASDLQEAMSAVDTVFGDAAESVLGFQGSVASSLGLSRQEALSAAATFGALYQSVGLTEDQMASFANQSLQAAADLASFYNVPLSDALVAIRAGLVGEAEPLRRFGILMDADTVKAKAMAMGLADANGELSNQALIMARQTLIMEGLGAAQGDFARTSGGLANRMRILKAQLKDAAATMGAQLLPIALKVVNAISRFAKWTESLSDRQRKWVLILLGVAAAIGPVLLVLGHLIGAIVAIGPALAILTGPFGIALALIIAFAIAYKTNFLGIRDITNKVIDVLKTLIEYFRYVIKDGDYMNDFLGNLPGWMQPIVKVVGIVVGALADLIRYLVAVVTGAKPFGDALKEMPGWLQPFALVLGRVVKTLRVFFKTWADEGFLAALKKIPAQIRAFGRAIDELVERLTGSEALSEAVEAIFNRISFIFADVVNLVDALIHGRWAQAWDAFKSLVVNAVKLAWEYLKLQFAVLVTLFQAIPWGAIGSALWAGLQGAVGFMVATGLPWMAQKAGELFQWFLTGAQAFWEENIKPWLISLPALLLAAIGDVSEKLLAKGRALMRGLFNGIKTLWEDKVKPWFAGLPARIGKIIDTIPESLKSGFSGIYDVFRGYGESIINGLVDGVRGLLGELEGIVNDIINQINRIPFLDVGNVNVSAATGGGGGGFAVASRMPLPNLPVVGGTSTTMTTNVTLGAGAIQVNGTGQPQEVASEILTELFRAVRRVEAGAMP